MARLLYMKASPLVDRSYSVAVADAYVEAYRAAHPSDTVDVLDVFHDKIPPFDGPVVRAKYAILHGKDHTEEEAEAWKAVVETIERLKSADRVVMAVAMWNFGIPYPLKQYFDVIVQPGLAFSYSPDTGYTGLVKGKPFLGVYARGGEYLLGTGGEELDFQQRYLEAILGFIGFEEMESIVVEPTLMGGPETAAAKRDEAIKKAKELAAAK